MPDVPCPAGMYLMSLASSYCCFSQQEPACLASLLFSLVYSETGGHRPTALCPFCHISGSLQSATLTRVYVSHGAVVLCCQQQCTACMKHSLWVVGMFSIQQHQRALISAWLCTPPFAFWQCMHPAGSPYAGLPKA